VELPSNPLAVLTFISAPAVLTNAACVLLFGTGNRYGRAIDRVHELAGQIGERAALSSAELKLRIRQLESTEARASLIVRSLTCFYTAAAALSGSTLASLVGAVLAARGAPGAPAALAIAFLAGGAGVLAMISGAALLARETTFSFKILREENKFLAMRMSETAGKLAEASGRDNKSKSVERT
jgi:hypothetical protein